VAAATLKVESANVNDT